MKKLIFKIGEESLPKIIGENELDNSPFAEAVKTGISMLKEGITADPDVNLTGPHGIFINNITAFLGDRGSGKTSCLLSTIDNFLNSDLQCGRKCKDIVEVIPIIDPSFFDNTHNILDIFLGRIYHKYQTECRMFGELNTERREKLKLLQTKFKETKQAIYFINDEKRDNLIDELQELRRLSDGMELNRIIHELVRCYLDYIGKKHLLLAIDDLDLNIREAYVMMEQIRKYLMLPNVNILLAARPQQLRQSVCHALVTHFDRSLGRYISEKEIAEMADRYLEKFIPTNKRVYMPAPEDLMKSELLILDGERTRQFETVEFAVLSLIFEKTGFLFYNRDGETSLIVPNNLRELRDLTTLLFKMESADSDVVHKANKTQFREYFRGQWIETLPAEEKQFALNVLSESNLHKLNKFVVTHLYHIAENLTVWQSFSDKDTALSKRTVASQLRINEIVNPANNPMNVSVGDVMLLVNLLRKYEDSDRIRHLLFFITTYYSILLYELYDDMTDPANINTDGIADTEETPETIPLLHNASNSELPDYFNLVGGSFFTLTGDSFIPFKTISRELVKIDGWAITTEIRSLLKEKPENRQSPEFADRLRLVEFFILSLRRNIRTKNARYAPDHSDNWRTDVATRRFEPFNNAKNILFDITAPFVNLIYPRYAYDRFHSEIYDLAIATKGSLLNELLDSERRHPENRFADLMSRMAIRNMEVLEDIDTTLSNNRNRLRPDGSDELGLLIDFFKRASDYKVKTYDREAEKSSFHTITFEPLKLLSNVLSKVPTDRYLSRLFDRIYAPVNNLVAGTSYSEDELIRLILQLPHKAQGGVLSALNEIMRNRFNISSDDFIAALSDHPLLEKETVSTLFDNELTELYKSEIASRSNARVAELKDAEEQSDEQVKSLKARIEAIKSDFISRQAMLERLNSLKNDLSQKESAAGILIESLSNDREKALSRIKEIEESNIQLENENIASLKEIENKRSEFRLITRRIAMREDHNRRMGDRQTDNMIARLDALKTERATTEAAIAELEKKIQWNNSRQAELRSEHSVLAAKISEFVENLPKAVADRTDISSKLENLQHEIDSAREGIEELRSQIAECDKQIAEAKHNHETIRTRLEKARSAHRSLMIKLNRM